MSVSASKKELPYEVDAKYDVINILKRRHEIPYHSRPFMWSREAHIEHVVLEMIQASKENDLYWLGSVILYTGDDYPAISDAQHRLTLCFLIILVLSRSLSYPKALEWISMYGCEDMILTPEIPESDNNLLEKYGWTRLPNIVSCYEEDLIALGNILNEKEVEDKEKNNLYDAYKTIEEIIICNLPEKADKRGFLQFMYNDVKVLRIAISDWNFTIRVFNSFNNIKVPVPPSYLLKNAFAEAIGEEHSSIIHDIFCDIKRGHKGKEDYEQFVHTTTNLWKRQLMPYKEYERVVGSIVLSTMELGTRAGSGASTCPLHQFREVAAKIDTVTSLIEADPYGRLLQKLTRGREVMNLLLRPLGVIIIETGDMTPFYSLIRMLLAFTIRQQKPLTFNPLAMQSAIIPIVNKLLSRERTISETVADLQKLLRHWLKSKPGETNVGLTIALAAEHYTHNAFIRARAMLLYLVLKTDCHESTLNQDATQIDHIYPKTPGTSHPELVDKDARHMLGNFTPFVGSNSTDGMKGNSSLGNKPFVRKVPFYEKSNLALTRDVAARYGASGKFLDTEISERTGRLAQQIAHFTGIELGLG